MIDQSQRDPRAERHGVCWHRWMLYLVMLLVVSAWPAWSMAACEAMDEERAASGNEEHAEEPPAGGLDAEAIGRIVGAEARATDHGVVRVTWPRSRVPVEVDGMRLPPAAGLTSWAGFMGDGAGATVMGDTVVFQDEVDAAMDAAFAHDLEVTALHNHFFYDEPKVYFLHLGGRGDATALAHGVRAVWDAIRKVRRDRPTPASSFPGTPPGPGGELNASAIGRIVGAEPSTNDGVVKVSFARQATVNGDAVGGPMGLTSWAAFTGSPEHATVDGDLAMTAEEVQPTLRALRRADIHVVALHHHMIGETPAYYFAHFWAKGPAAELARGFRSALDVLEP